MSGRPVGATALLLHGQPGFDRCFGTPVSALALLLVLRHSCCVGRHILYDATAPQYYIVSSGTYCTASYSFLMIGLCSQKVIL